MNNTVIMYKKITRTTRSNIYIFNNANILISISMAYNDQFQI